MPNRTLPTGLKQAQKARDIGMNIGLGVVQRITHPGLGREMDHNIGPLRPAKARDTLLVGDIPLLKDKPLTGREPPQPILFQRNGIIIVEVIQPNNGSAPLQQTARHMKPDKTRHARDQKFHAGDYTDYPEAVESWAKLGIMY